MKSLAAFIMRGRGSAALIASVAAVSFWLFPPLLIVSGAVVALVALRRGPVEGALIMALAGTVAVALSWQVLGAPWPMLDVLLTVWLPVWLLALVLRATISLSQTLQAAAMLGLLGVAGFYLALGDPVVWWNPLLDQFQQELATLAPVGPSGDQALLEQWLELLKAWAPWLPGQVVGAVMMVVLLALLLGRWQQALLFNPGGFRPEFHELQLGRPLATFTLALFGATLAFGWPPLANGLLVLGVPYTVQGITLVHAIVLKRRLSSAWLVLFYLLLVPLLSQVVMTLGVVDAWADFRSRIRARPDAN
ncbi:MAG: hypothetical protein KDJ31_02000 [Candidatus Competibacteraceae bacterium]|nr:hypothetical protein [Candidatus Competibacteraceae bacterium]HRY14684.1 hypothetical protein [Candidatus Competibacteraceae bacterium]